jgi:hypothetical protein
MCPACLATTAWSIVGAGSVGWLAALFGRWLAGRRAGASRTSGSGEGELVHAVERGDLVSFRKMSRLAR